MKTDAKGNRGHVCFWPYSHQGDGPRADQTGRIHISDFRKPRAWRDRPVVPIHARCGMMPVRAVITVGEVSRELWEEVGFRSRNL